MKPNKHNWDSMFTGSGVCRICWDAISTGTGKAGHSLKHVREGKAKRVGCGTKPDPYRYVIANGSNAALCHPAEDAGGAHGQQSKTL